MPGCRALTDSEIELIGLNLGNILTRPHQLWMIFQVCKYTGLRIGQVLELTIQQVDGVDVIHIPRKRVGHTKQSTPRDIPVHLRLKGSLECYLNELRLIGWAKERKDRLFTLSYDQCEHRLKEVVLRHNLPGKVNWHSLRHSFVKKMYAKLDKDIVATSKAVGHSNISNTAIYVGVDHDKITKAILD